MSAREIGRQAVWTLSTCKQGFGVEQLRDGDAESYWQSDGVQPHVVNIQFLKRSDVVSLRLYVDFKKDESYTPKKISVRSGTTFHDLQDIQTYDMEEPSGWFDVPLETASGKPLRTNLVQVAILENHQSGRDTHVRQIQIFGPMHRRVDALNAR